MTNEEPEVLTWVNLKNNPSPDADLDRFSLLLGPSSRKVEITELIISRDGGPTADDANHRWNLYFKVGSVTIAGAHIEHLLKRLLRIVTGSDLGMMNLNSMWERLHRELDEACKNAPTEPKLIALQEVLDWSESMKIRDKRNEVVHGEWWLYRTNEGSNNAIMNRPKRDSSTLTVYSFKTLSEVEDLCWEYVKKLDALVGDDWPRGVLPSIQSNQQQN